MPSVKLAKSTKIMKGRQITTEAFDRMLAVVPKAIQARLITDASDAERSCFAAYGGVGLRLGDSLTLRWDGMSDPGRSSLPCQAVGPC